MGKKKVTASIGTTIQNKNVGKVYTQKVDTSSSNSTKDEDILKVELSTKLTDTLVTMILSHMKSNAANAGPLHATRLTQFKLSEIYQNLADIGFKTKQIESAMTNCIPSGGDMISMLDWLCLNTENDCLPTGFSECLEKASVKKSPFTRKKEEKKPEKPVVQIPKKVVKIEKPSYLSTIDLPSSDSDYSDDLDVDVTSEVQNDPEDINSTYLELYAKFMDMKGMAARAKADKDKAQKKFCSKEITTLLCEMDKIEKMDAFDPRVKIDLFEKEKSEVRAGGINNIVDNNDKEDKSDKEGKGDKGDKGDTAPAVVEEKMELMDFTYTRKQWTGKSPKQFLIDWMRKNLPKTNAATYNKSQKRGGGYVCRIKFTTQSGSVASLQPRLHCLHAKDSEYLAATLALYTLCSGKSVHMLLPPMFRDVWLDWLAEEKAVKQGNVQAANKPRDDYVTKLFKKLNITGAKQKLSRPRQVSDAEEDVSDKSEVNDNWEDLDTDDDGEEEEEDEQEEDAIKERSERTRSKDHKPKANHTSSTSSASSMATLRKLFDITRTSSNHVSLLKTRQQLPVYKHRQEILDMISDNQVILIMGETGSGKSTQIPQFLLEEFLSSNGNIVCTQPRRVSATSLASRVADELGTTPPGGDKSLCGYQIRFESKVSRVTRLTYCTTGVLLRQLISHPHLDHISHIIIDEVHERNIQSDFLLILLKRILKHRDCKLKIILMSATIDENLFARYFDNCPVLSIPGRCFPVEIMHLEDILDITPYQMDRDCKYALRDHVLLEESSSKYKVKVDKGKSRITNVTYSKDDLYSIDYTDLSEDYKLSTRNLVTQMRTDIVNVELIVELLRTLHTDTHYNSIKGGILIFLPGYQTIQELRNLLLSEKLFSNPKKYKIVTMHSLLTSDEQTQAFRSTGSATKIVLATNIAESGITIPDIVYVIDTGRVKETRYMESCDMSRLIEVNVSQASAKQRKGRAGRVRNGFCFRMFTQKSYDEMKAFTLAEIVRVPLEELCLHIMKSNYGDPAEFLKEALDRPSPLNVKRAMTILYTVGACYYSDEATSPLLTALGNHLALLPIDVKLGKMLIFGAIFGVLQATAIIAASMSVKSIFSISTDNRNEADAIIADAAFSNSDHLTCYKLYLGWTLVKGTAQEQKYISKYFLNRSSLQEILKLSEDLEKQLKSAGFGDVDLSTLLNTTVKRTSRQANVVKDGVVNISSTTDILSSIQASKLSKPIIAVLKSVIAASLYPNIAITQPRKDIQNSSKPCNALTSQGLVCCHPGSVNFKLSHNGWLAYNEKMKSTKTYIRQSTLISPYSILLFGGNIHIEHTSMLVKIDNFATFKTCAKTAVIFKELRNLINEHLLTRFNKQGNTDTEIIGVILDVIISERTI